LGYDKYQALDAMKANNSHSRPFIQVYFQPDGFTISPLSLKRMQIENRQWLFQFCVFLSPQTYPAGKKFYPVLSYGCALENAGISRNG
jgi:hypothetical protein